MTLTMAQRAALAEAVYNDWLRHQEGLPPDDVRADARVAIRQDVGAQPVVPAVQARLQW